jgi:16S rRNA (cytosine967-C5)-methyltransferase
MIAPARRAAFGVLREVASGQRTLPDALARAASHLGDERDRALAAEITTGTLRWQGALDHVIARLASRPLAEVDGDVLLVLRLSAYQLRHLERVPGSAVVHDAVELIRQAGHPAATRFVNAVLRTLAAGPRDAPLPARPAADELDPLAGGERVEAIAYLSTALSHPAWLVSRWLDRYGFARTEAWCEFNNGHAPLTLRANTLATTREALAADLESHGVATEPTRYAPHGLRVTRGQPLRTPLSGAGHFFVQDEASQLVTGMAAARPGQSVLDTCAAPGGKTVALAADMKDTGRIVAVDLRPRRMRLLARTVRESGARCVRLVQADLERGLPFAAGFDCVFVDAPCSGLGTVRRDPEIKWRRHEADLAPLAARQLRLLAEAATHVAPGGRLVYATCSSEPDENDAVVARFLDAHPGYRRIDPRVESAATPVAPLLEPDGTLRTDPARHGLEAFYAVAMRRATTEPLVKSAPV